MGPGNMAMSNIGGMHQVRHSFKYVLTLFSGCNGPPDHEQHGDESVDCVVYTAACSHFEVCKLSGSFLFAYISILIFFLQSFCVDEWVRAEVMDLVQLATGLTVLTAGLMVLCLLVAGLCACTSSRRKTVKHCETSQVEFEANAKPGLQPFPPILRQTVYREPNPSDTFLRPSDTFLRTSDTFLRPTDTFPRPFDTFPRTNPIGLIVEAPQIYPIL